MAKKLPLVLRLLDDQEKVSVREAFSYVVTILGLLLALAGIYIAIKVLEIGPAVF